MGRLVRAMLEAEIQLSGLGGWVYFGVSRCFNGIERKVGFDHEIVDVSCKLSMKPMMGNLDEDGRCHFGQT